MDIKDKDKDIKDIKDTDIDIKDKDIGIKDKDIDIKDPLNINDDSSTNIGIEILTFIENYRNLPVLWDLTIEDYSDKTKKNEAYETLLNIYRQTKKSATLVDVKRKINSLRTNYRKELTKIEFSKRSGACGDNIYKPKGWIFKELSFLNKVQFMRSKYRKDQFMTDENISCDVSIEEEVPAKSFISIKKPKLMENNLKKMQNEVLSNSCKEDTITKCWSYKLTKINSDQRIWAEKFINDILIEGILGTLHRHSLSINQNEIVNSTSTSTNNKIE